VPPSAVAERNRFAQRLFTPLPARYDRLAELLSFGQNARWRRAMVDQIVPAGARSILDVASGTAGVALQLAARTTARVVGVDLTEQMLRQGKRNVAAAGRSDGIGLVVGRAEQLPFPDAAFDALTFTYLLRYVDDPMATMAELARVVKPGGAIGMVEFGAPRSPALLGLWRVHTRVALPLIGRLISDAWFEVGRFLGPSIEGFDADLPTIWREAGIDDVHTRRMSFGAGMVMWGFRRNGERGI
jgi:demethylmenaquinone methyltransferase/2-methoxy-6-polyprenyl-1,4-benzoquinol methylase